MNSEVKMQHFLDEFTDALFNEQPEPRDVVVEHDVPYDDAMALVHMVENLNQTLQPVTMPKAFKTQLKRELTGQRKNVVHQWRDMPARVHWAAIVTVIGGFLLLLRGRLFDNERKKIEEVATL